MQNFPLIIITVFAIVAIIITPHTKSDKPMSAQMARQTTEYEMPNAHIETIRSLNSLIRTASEQGCNSTSVVFTPINERSEKVLHTVIQQFEEQGFRIERKAIMIGEGDTRYVMVISW